MGRRTPSLSLPFKQIMQTTPLSVKTYLPMILLGMNNEHDTILNNTMCRRRF